MRAWLPVSRRALAGGAGSVGPGKARFSSTKLTLAYTAMFFGGAGLEWAKVHWWPNGVNFYDVRRRNFVRDSVDAYARRLDWDEKAIVQAALTSNK